MTQDNSWQWGPRNNTYWFRLTNVFSLYFLTSSIFYLMPSIFISLKGNYYLCGSPSTLLTLPVPPTSISTDSTIESSTTLPFLNKCSQHLFHKENQQSRDDTLWTLCHNKYQRASSCIIETMILLLSENNYSTCFIPLLMLINFPYILFHTYSLILSSPYPSSLTLASHFQQYFPHSHGYMFGSLLSYKHVLLGHLLATSQELTFLSLFPCLKLMPSAHAYYSFFPLYFTKINIS